MILDSEHVEQGLSAVSSQSLIGMAAGVTDFCTILEEFQNRWRALIHEMTGVNSR